MCHGHSRDVLTFLRIVIGILHCSHYTMEGSYNSTPDLDATAPINMTSGLPPSSASTAAVIIILLVIVTGVLGNILVCLAVTQFKNLRTVANYFVVSLAVADLLVCTAIMPFALYQEITGGLWYLHEALCRVWTALDIMLSTASILHLCAISVDRFSAITAPIKYVAKRTTNMAFSRIAVVWILSSFVSGPALFLTIVEDSACIVSVNATVYAVCSSVVSFYIPCLVILVVYFKIYDAAKRRARRAVGPAPVRTVSKAPQINSQEFRLDGNHGVEAGPSSTNGEVIPPVGASAGVPPPRPGLSRLEGVDSVAGMLSTRAKAQSRISLVHERRAARTIGIVVGAFIVCWLPFFTLHSIFNPLCSSSMLPCEAMPTLYRVFTWVGWCNSTLNPIIYTVFNEEFRQAFHKLLRCRRNR